MDYATMIVIGLFILALLGLVLCIKLDTWLARRAQRRRLLSRKGGQS